MTHALCTMFNFYSHITLSSLEHYRSQIHTDCLTYTSSNYQHLLNPRSEHDDLTEHYCYGEKEEVTNDTKKQKQKQKPSNPISCIQPTCLSLHLTFGSSQLFLDSRQSHDHCNMIYIFWT